MSIGKRIASIIEEKGYSKNSVAKNIGIHPTTLNNWIIEKTSPDNLKLDALCTYLGLNLEWLLKGEGEVYTPNITERKVKYNEGVPVHPNYKEVPLVGQYAQAGYLCGFGDIEYIESLPTLVMPVDHDPRGNYMVFEVKGDSMFDGSYDSLVEGDLLLCREIDFDFWKSKLFIKKWNNFVVVHKEDGILVKKIIEHDVDRGLITLHSLNPLYKDRVMSLNEVAQLFSVVKITRSGNV